MRAPVLLWGQPGAFAYQVFHALARAGQNPAGVVIPGRAGTGWQPQPPPQPPASDFVMISSFVTPGLAESAWDAGVPLYSCDSEWNAETLAAVAALAPALIVVACWHARLPDALLAIPTFGGINIHPSRLPDFRGPVPLFWQRRAGLTEIAVTLHAMTAAWDAGAIYTQQVVPLPDGATMAELDNVTGAAGGGALAALLPEVLAGRATPAPQAAGGSYQSFPRTEDFTIPTSWTARRAWNFMRAAESFGTPFAIVSDGRARSAARALAYRPGNFVTEPMRPFPTGTAVQFESGVVVVE